MSDFSLSRSVIDGTTVIAAGPEVDIYSAPKLRAELRPAATSGDVVVDLNGCEFLDSTGLGVIVGALKAARLAGHDLVVACSAEAILKVFRTAGLTLIMKICDTTDEAVKEVAGNGQLSVPAFG